MCCQQDSPSVQPSPLCAPTPPPRPHRNSERSTPNRGDACGTARALLLISFPSLATFNPNARAAYVCTSRCNYSVLELYSSRASAAFAKKREGREGCPPLSKSVSYVISSTYCIRRVLRIGRYLLCFGERTPHTGYFCSAVDYICTLVSVWYN